ncbi:MAG: hypothetical protein ABJB74_14030 [Gemmatimonas sp.]
MKYILRPYYQPELPSIEYTEIDFQNILSARRNSLLGLTHECLLEILLQNYEEFESELLAPANRTSTATSDWARAIDEMQVLGRRLSNFLSSSKAYIDQLPQISNAMFGDGAAGTAELKALCSSEYDSSQAGYRVCTALRNHVQHKGYGIHHISYAEDHNTIVADGMTKVLAIIPKVSVDILASDSTFKKSILHEISSAGEVLHGERLHDLRPWVRQFMNSLAKIHLRAREMFDPIVSASDKSVADAVADYSSRYTAAKSQALALLTLSEDRTTVEGNPHFLGSQQVNQRTALIVKNMFPFSRFPIEF